MTTGGGTTAEIQPFSGAVNMTVYGGTSPFTYAWTGPNGFTASTEDISGLEAGTYSVTVTDANGCTSSASYTVDDLTDLGVVGLNANSFNLFPNPSNGVFNVLLHNSEKLEYSVSVTDFSGRVIYSETTTTESVVIDLSDKANGSYMLHLSNGNGHATKRIVLKK